MSQITLLFQDYFHNVAFLSFILILAGPLLLSLVDFIVLARTRRRPHIRLHEFTPESNDFTILIPIFGHLRYLKNIEFLKQYASHVVLCTTTKESSEFNAGIAELSEQYGFRVFRSEIPHSSHHKPNPWRLFKTTLTHQQNQMFTETTRDEIIRDSFRVVTTKYCIFLDGDTVVKERLEKLVGKVEERGYDISSVRVVASRRNTIMEKLQAIEYELAMDARRIYPWLTSGAGMVARTDVIKDIMTHHSLFFSGGDIEIGKLAMLLGYKVGHISCEFLTDVPETFKGWVKQRLAWSGGSFRHCVVNLHNYGWQHPFFYFYTTFVVFFLIPLRWWELFHRPEVIPLVIAIYWGLIGLFHWKHLEWYYLLFPFYSLFQVMILIPLGCVSYFQMLYRSQNIGFIKIRKLEMEPVLVEDIGL
jgi:cellulose synthase/poly-beta-1,6-N-acetylglucosamine synthase-like glycosyltransferase